MFQVVKSSRTDSYITLLGLRPPGKEVRVGGMPPIYDGSKTTIPLRPKATS